MKSRMPREKSKITVSAAQTNILCNFFEENPEVLRGYKKTPKCKDVVQRKWRNVTPNLNAVGPPRDHKSWSKYLSDMKAKLKTKRIKWRQTSDGKSPIMCNTNEFNEIKLRMLQVLRKDVFNSPDTQDFLTSDLETEDDNNEYDQDNVETDIMMPELKPKLEKSDRNNTPLPELQPPQIMVEDEFDYFGKNVAEQLRTLPLIVALETQEMLLTVLKKQRLKVLHETSSSSDPLSKH